MCTLRRLLGRKWLLLRLLSVSGHNDLGDPSILESAYTSFGDAFPPHIYGSDSLVGPLHSSLGLD